MRNQIAGRKGQGLKAIRVEGLTKIYKSGFMKKTSLTAVNNLSFEIDEGEIYGFLGPNGAGKTTTLLCLLGLISYEEGKVEVMGRNPEASGAIFKKIGYVPEEPSLYGFLTGEEFLFFSSVLKEIEKSKIPALVHTCLKRFELLDSAKRLIRTYSKGMKQRLQIAESIINSPKIIFLDEPTRGLDPIGVKIVRDIIEELSRNGTTVFLNSHVLSEVEMTCTRVGILNKGKMAWEGNPKEISRQSNERKIILRLPDESKKKEEFKKVENGESLYEVLSEGGEKFYETMDLIKNCGGEVIEVLPLKNLEDYFLEKVRNENE